MVVAAAFSPIVTLSLLASRLAFLTDILQQTLGIPPKFRRDVRHIDNVVPSRLNGGSDPVLAKSELRML